MKSQTTNYNKIDQSPDLLYSILIRFELVFVQKLGKSYSKKLKILNYFKNEIVEKSLNKHFEYSIRFFTLLERPLQESNLQLLLRRELLYPLN